MRGVPAVLLLVLLAGACSSTQTGAVESTVAAEAIDPGGALPSPAEAAYARAAHLTSSEVTVSQMVTIYADDRLVDLRVKVEGVGFCRWFGVTGLASEDRLAWTAGPGEGVACTG